VWSLAGELDAVVVCSPNRFHVPHALAAIDAGLPVVVDKPLAASAAEAREVVDAARRRGVVLTVFQNRRWDGDLLTVRRLIAEGELGRVLRFESRFERWRPEVGGGWRERAEPEEAGGLLYDLGSHLIDQALHLFGPVEDVYAELDARRPGAQVDDDAFIALRHTSGVRSHLWMSAVTARLGPRMRVLGDRAGYVKHGLDVQEEALRAGRGPAGDPAWGEEPPERWGTLGTDADARPIRTEPGDYPAFYAAFARAVLQGAPPPVEPAQVVAALEVLDAARAQAGG
jgi:predicted dehydrogenase